MQALEGKDIKELLTNVGSGGPAAPAGAAAGGAAEAPAEAAGEEKKKEEGKVTPWVVWDVSACANSLYREGGVRRGHGLRSLRLSVSSRFPFLVSSSIYLPRFVSCLVSLFFLDSRSSPLYVPDIITPLARRPEWDNKRKKNLQRTKGHPVGLGALLA